MFASPRSVALPRLKISFNPTILQKILLRLSFQSVSFSHIICRTKAKELSTLLFSEKYFSGSHFRVFPSPRSVASPRLKISVNPTIYPLIFGRKERPMSFLEAQTRNETKRASSGLRLDLRVKFQYWNHWTQFESCLKSSSERGAICIKLDLVESEKFSA